MSGNVLESCWDWYAVYPGTSTDYRGPASGTARMVRGGSYGLDAFALTVSFRDFGYPYSGHPHYGFRFARTY
jgi:formylglycine-generating enzyme